MKKILLIVCISLTSQLWAMANPASVYCVKQGNKLILKNEKGFCIFGDNSFCEEWSYYRGECTKGDNFFVRKHLKSRK